MARTSKYIKEEKSALYCSLPFCHTVEGEAFGGIINYGDDKAGPRAKEYIVSDLEGVLNLGDIDFTKGRISEVLRAVEILKSQGEKVLLEVCGPLTILNTIIDSKYVFIGMRKKPEIVKEIYSKISKNLLAYIKLAKETGVDVISYADPVASVNILGPKLTEKYLETFTYDFLKEVEKLIDEDFLVYLCPKTTLQLIGTERGVFEDIEISKGISYQEAMEEVKGKVHFLGDKCIKMSNDITDRGLIREIKIK